MHAMLGWAIDLLGWVIVRHQRLKAIRKIQSEFAAVVPNCADWFMVDLKDHGPDGPDNKKLSMGWLAVDYTRACYWSLRKGRFSLDLKLDPGKAKIELEKAPFISFWKEKTAHAVHIEIDGISYYFVAKSGGDTKSNRLTKRLYDRLIAGQPARRAM
jgi:hypothetical protein